MYVCMYFEYMRPQPSLEVLARCVVDCATTVHICFTSQRGSFNFHLLPLPVEQGSVLELGVSGLFPQVSGVACRLLLPLLVGLDHFFQGRSFARVYAGASVVLVVLPRSLASGLQGTAGRRERLIGCIFRLLQRAKKDATRSGTAVSLPCLPCGLSCVNGVHLTYVTRKARQPVASRCDIHEATRRRYPRQIIGKHKGVRVP